MLVVSGLPVFCFDGLSALLPRVTVLYAVDPCRRNIRFEAQGCNVHNGIAFQRASQRLPSQPLAPSPRGATRYVRRKWRTDLLKESSCRDGIGPTERDSGPPNTMQNYSQLPGERNTRLSWS